MGAMMWAWGTRAPLLFLLVAALVSVGGRGGVAWCGWGEGQDGCCCAQVGAGREQSERPVMLELEAVLFAY